MTVPLYNLTDTWNSGSTVFTAIKMNVTDTNSDSASLLMDLQVGSVSQFSVSKFGTVVIPNLMVQGFTAPVPIFGFDSVFQQVSTDALFQQTILTYGNSNDVGGFVFAKNRNTVPDGQTVILQNSDIIGATFYYGADGDGYQIAAQINANVDGSPSSGNVPGRLEFATTPVGGGGSPSVRLIIYSPGNVAVNTNSVATNATDGFLYIPTCAGTPTGTPTSLSGRVPMVYDTTNHQFWIYDSGWKQPKTPAGAATVTWQ